MLIGAIAPYKTTYYNNNTAEVQLQRTTYWTEGTTDVNVPWKYQILKAITYEDTICKIEQVQLTQYQDSKLMRQEVLNSYLLTRITPKKELHEVNYDPKGYNQTYTMVNGLNKYPYNQNYDWKRYKLTEDTGNASNIQYFFDVTEWNTAQIFLNWSAITNNQTNYGSDTTITALNKYGRTSGAISNSNMDIIVMAEKLSANWYYDSNPAFNPEPDYEHSPTNYDWLYGQPYNTVIRYWWLIDPDTVDNYEVVDVQGLMLTILGMPMAWITQAFNFTLWPGTPYALNVGHVLSAVIIASVIIIIIKKVYN